MNVDYSAFTAENLNLAISEAVDAEELREARRLAKNARNAAYRARLKAAGVKPKRTTIAARAYDRSPGVKAIRSIPFVPDAEPIDLGKSDYSSIVGHNELGEELVKHFIITAAFAVLGHVTSKKAVQAVMADKPDDFVVASQDDLEQFSEAELRTILENVNGQEAGTAAKAKKATQQQRVWDALTTAEAAQKVIEAPAAAPKPAKEPKAPKEPRVSAKSHIRGLFPNVGDTVTADALGAGTNFTPSALSTAISDLKSAKYAAGPTMNIKRIKAEDGGISYRREADVVADAAAGEPAATV